MFRPCSLSTAPPPDAIGWHWRLYKSVLQKPLAMPKINRLVSSAPDFQARLSALCALPDNAQTIAATQKIIAAVRQDGDDALLELTERFDGHRPSLQALWKCRKKRLMTLWRPFPDPCVTPWKNRLLACVAIIIIKLQLRGNTPTNTGIYWASAYHRWRERRFMSPAAKLLILPRR